MESNRSLMLYLNFFKTVFYVWGFMKEWGAPDIEISMMRKVLITGWINS